MPFYWDTSALLAMLFNEPSSAKVHRVAHKENDSPGYTSFFTLVEMETAYARHIAKNSLTHDALAELRLHAQELESNLGILWADKEILANAKHYIAEMGLRPGDALQLASAQILAQKDPDLTFVSLDDKLNKAAQALGLSVPW